MNKLIALFALTLSLNVTANTGIDVIDNFGDFSKADASVSIGALSYHYSKGQRETLNQSHPSIGIELWDISVNYTTANSFNNSSLYVTYAPELFESEYLDISTPIGFASGYGEDARLCNENNHCYHSDVADYKGIIPVAGIQFSVKTIENIATVVTVSPMVTTLQAKFSF